MSAPNWILGPGGFPDGLAGVQALIEDVHGPAGDLTGLESTSEAARTVVLSVSDVSHGEAAVDWLNGLSVGSNVNVVAIVGDGYLGTDVQERSLATLGASAVSAVRSLAATRGSSVRANVISVPESLLGDSREQRGPLVHKTEPGDVVDALLFFMDEASSYVSGQVLFVDGGRHLFSSHTA